MPHDEKDHPNISLLGPDDLPHLLALSCEVGWSHAERDWKTMLSTGTTFGHRTTAPTNKLASCIHMTEFGSSFATLGMLVVSKSHQKKGLATKLVHRLMAHNNHPNKERSIGLITASQAQSFYPQFGFQTTGEHILKMTRRKRERNDMLDVSMSTYCKVAPIATANDIQEVIRFDRRVSQLERGSLVENLLKTVDRSFFAVHHDTTKDASLVGYGIAKYQGDLLNIGPIVSSDSNAALALCERLTKDHDGPIRMDVYESQQDYVQKVVDSLGFHQEDRQAVMINNGLGTGNNDSPPQLPGNRQVMFCPASQAWL